MTDANTEIQPVDYFSRLCAACSYLRTLELAPSLSQEEDDVEALLAAFDAAEFSGDRRACEGEWRQVRRFLRRFEGRVSDVELFEYYARRDFQSAWTAKNAEERREFVASQFGVENPFKLVAGLKNYALNLANATTVGDDAEAKREKLVAAIASNDEAAFTLSEYASALDDYGSNTTSEELKNCCEELTNFLRDILLAEEEKPDAAPESGKDAEETPEEAPEEATREPAADFPPKPATPVPEPPAEPAASSTDAPAAEEQNDESASEEAELEKSDGYYRVSEELAKASQEANSFRPYVPQTATREYRNAVDAARAVAERQKEKVDPEFHERIDAALDSYERKLAIWYDKFHRNSASCPSIMIVGAANFPRDRHEAKVRRVGELLREHERLSEMVSKIETIGTGGIRSDDAQALQKLQARLALLKERHEQMKEANAYRRKNGSWDGYDGPLREFVNDDGTEIYQYFNLPNSSAEIRRVEQRIALITRHLNTDYGDDVPFKDGVVRFSKEENRIQIIFREKPEQAVLTSLKKRGFKWSSRNKAWQRMITPDAIFAARDLGYLPKEWKPAFKVERMDE